MPAVLAIDAAWTATQPSGVAVVRREGSQWRCAGVAPSYEAFITLAGGREVPWHTPAFSGSVADVDHLLAAAQTLAGCRIDVVAIDMPLSTTPIVSRRAADNAISKEFGSRKCSAHTPSSTRPGPLGEALCTALASAGYPLVTTQAVDRRRCTIEVYPHPALLSLMKRSSRVPYKASKSRKYWPTMTIGERIGALLQELTAIKDALDSKFGSLPFALPVAEEVRTLSALKRHEDALDALVCAWVATEFLAGNAMPLGNDVAAIWCPRDVVYS